MNNSPIGVFDSGKGGLSVWRELRRSLPEESLVYYGDGRNCPYGEKADAEVLGYVEAGVRQLLERGCKLIVLACNTATMAAITYLRENYDIPFVGIEPAVKPAAEATKTGVIGVLATRSALDSEWFAGVRERYSPDTEIIAGTGEGFVAAVEEGREDGPEGYELAKRALEPMLEAGADRIVLGCTHYPFMAEQMRRVIGGRDVALIDPAPAIVRRVEWLLDEYSLRAAGGHVPAYEFLTAGDGAYLESLREKAGKSVL